MSARSILDPQFRELALNRDAVDPEARTVEIAISSETPVERWFGIEILDHGPGAVDLGRMASGGPVLLDHDPSQLVGVLEGVRLDPDRVLRGTVRFGRSARAQEVLQDVQDGIRRSISVGYRILDHRTTKGQNGAPDTVRAIRWEPLESSFVAIPADVRVGVGRSLPPNPAREAETPEVRMVEQTTPTTPAASQAAPSAPPPADMGGAQRAADIMALCSRHAIPSEQAQALVLSGRSVESVGREILDVLAQRHQPIAAPGAEAIELSEREAKAYSIAGAILACADKRNSLEMEISQDLAKRLGRNSAGVFIPTNLMKRAALDTKTTGAAKELVYTEAGEFIELLRGKTMVLQLGARLLSGLQGNIAFPRQTGTAQAYWVGDNPATGVTQSNLTLDQVTMSPKQLQATTQYSRMLLAQGVVNVDALVTEDLAAIHALALDAAALIGTGASNQPTGLLNTSGIGAVALGTNGLQPTYDSIVDLESAITVANADIAAMAYLTTPGIKGRLKKTPQLGNTANIPIWQGSELNGYRAEATTQVPSNLVKGTSSNCHAIIFGVWNQLLVGEWGALELIPDPLTLADRGLIKITSIQLADLAVRHPQSFAAIKDALV